MKNDSSEPTTAAREQPVAYDSEGRPLYHQPATEHAPLKTEKTSHVSAAPETAPGENYDPRTRVQYGNEPDVTHVTRPLESTPFEISSELLQKHLDSKQRYPFLNLSKGEFVMLNIKRHPIGLVIPVLLTSIVVMLLLAVLIFYPELSAAALPTALPAFEVVFAPIMLFALLVALGGGVVIWVYLQNQFFLTNESVIQEIQQGLFARHEQTVSLGSIEDASFRQNGLLQTILDYGTIRLSTEGQETTYRFAYVTRPKKQIATVNNAVEAFKNGRPVGEGLELDD